MNTLTNIKNGDFTDKGLVKMVDNPWVNSDGSVADRLVITSEGAFRETELSITDKPVIQMDKPEHDCLSNLRDMVYNIEDQLDSQYSIRMFGNRHKDIDAAYNKAINALSALDKVIENKLK